MGKSLKKMLKKCVVPSVNEQLAVADAKLGSVIKVSRAVFIRRFIVFFCSDARKALVSERLAKLSDTSFVTTSEQIFYIFVLWEPFLKK
jgi:hypothetical protein